MASVARNRLHEGRNRSEINMARNPIKILIVDDDQDVLIELEHLREGEGYSTATARSVRRRLRCRKSRRLNSPSWMSTWPTHAHMPCSTNRSPPSRLPSARLCTARNT